MLRKRPVLEFIRKITSPVFTTRDLANFCGRSLSATVQSLNFLKREGFIFKLSRGLWAQSGHQQLSPFKLVPFLLPRQRAYVSFISALHLYGIIEQIPQTITLASTTHSKVIRTSLGTFAIHQIQPSFFCGFHWYRESGDFLIAEPEKALVDCLYLSARKKRQFGHFPELYFPSSFSFARARAWAGKISDRKIKARVRQRLKELLKA
ncbi:MAG: hypothetical protein HZB36_01585 [Candidatus Omnitrophica bacterium]|nr:hypothetical protein [Candidatus Omnitrophota bacterium]